jgi:nitroreductase
MDFTKVVHKRRMVRNYADVAVATERIEQMIDNALRAPSAGHTQGWAFLVLDDSNDVSRFWSATTPPGEGSDSWSMGMRRAPVIIVPLSSKKAYLDRYAEPDKGWTDRAESRWPAPYWDIDAGMASLLILLTAVDEGLGACFFGVPPTQVAAFRDEFGVPQHYTPIGAITVGYAAPDVRSPSLKRGRRQPDQVVHRGNW